MMTETHITPTVALTALLVAGLRSGDDQAARQLVALRGPRLMAHAVRLLGEHEAARDVMQDAWVDILRGVQGLRDDYKFLPWALSIVSRKVARLIAARQSERRLVAAAQAEPSVATANGESGPQASDATRVRQALGQLSDDHRATLALFYLEDMTVAEVAEALGIPIGTVKTRLMHARQNLKLVLEGEPNGQN